jgi:hypothetical protein
VKYKNMTRILQEENLEIRNSKSIVSFDTKGGGRWEIWHRYISIEGKPAYEIGNICGTCSYYFERLDGANQSVHPTDLIEKLNEGLTSLDKKTIEKVSEIIPNGKYKILLLKIYPKKIEIGSKTDYFANEEVKLWGIDGFWGMPYNPKICYYRGTDQAIKKNEKIFEFIIPIFPQTWLETERINFYKQKFSEGKIPTAISLSVLDVKSPAIWINHEKPEFTGHWCLAHYILDGHHKIFAATELDKPINLICFLATEEGIYQTNDDIEILLSNI